MAVLTLKVAYNLLSIIFLGFLMIEVWQPDVETIIRSKEFADYHSSVMLRNKTIITIVMSLAISSTIIYYNFQKALKEREEYKKLKRENDEADQKRNKPAGGSGE